MMVEKVNLQQHIFKRWRAQTAWRNTS